jgi:predicted aldo/keto reductase-like oxidoreductase
MDHSRRDFLATGLSLPVFALGVPDPPAAPPSARKAAPLERRKLGKTGLEVTSLGFGCMLTPEGGVVERAAELGINYFDTARGYQGGNNEKMVGAALKSRRQQVHIATKSTAKTGAEALSHLETSLQELGTDYVDVWFLHAKSRAEELSDDLVEATATAKKRGLIRFAGVSVHSGFAEVFPAVIKRAEQLDVILTSYNFTMEPSIEGLMEDARKAGIGMVAMKTMAGGFRRVKPGEKLYDTLKKDGAMVAALRWALRTPKVDTTIPSMTDMDQLEANLAAMDSPFGPSDQAILADRLEEIRPLYCRMCGRCEGTCPKGLPVADVLRYLTYAEGYGEYRLGREQFLALPEDLLKVRCSDCATCAVSCPAGVRVSERLMRAQALFA